LGGFVRGLYIVPRVEMSHSVAMVKPTYPLAQRHGLRPRAIVAPKPVYFRVGMQNFVGDPEAAFESFSFSELIERFHNPSQPAKESESRVVAGSARLRRASLVPTSLSGDRGQKVCMGCATEAKGWELAAIAVCRPRPSESSERPVKFLVRAPGEEPERTETQYRTKFRMASA
jgi:hypothetical protein